MFAWLMLAGLLIEAIMGWPDWLDRRIGHPVRWFGWLTARTEHWANRLSFDRGTRILLGALASLALVMLATLAGVIIAKALPDSPLGFAIGAILASTLIASRSLYDHVAAVASAFVARNPETARAALSRIVGRDTRQMEEPAIMRAAIESLAENTSDGVIAPLFWGTLFGLPGLFAYKAINTLDSMIGHRNERYEAFGKFAARLDDLANLVPARLTGILFALCALSRNAMVVMWSDAKKHRSPNAGWPEAAMAGALGIRLSGPRRYGDAISNDSWLNLDAADPGIADLQRALSVYRRTIIVMATLLALIGFAIWRI